MQLGLHKVLILHPLGFVHFFDHIAISESFLKLDLLANRVQLSVVWLH